jgi:photosystem II stability/assembly factor-like uncharacterized protein
MKSSLLVSLISISALITLSFAQDPARVHQPTLTPQKSGTTERLQSVSPVNAKVVWASGLGGTFVVTSDGGDHWTAGVVTGAESLQFRGVVGVSRQVAYLLSSGVGTDSRIYKTTDGGATWTMQFQNQNPNAFYDCLAFWTPRRGIAQSDSVNGVFPDRRTTNGLSWQDISANMPPALSGEGSFAASNTCVATQGRRNAWIATTNARVLATTDGGDTWNAYNTPLVCCNGTAGAFTVAFRNATHGIVGGGDFLGVNAADAATSTDGGRTWTFTSTPPVAGAIFGLSYAYKVSKRESERDDEFKRTVVVTGPGGSAWTPDEGSTWFTFPNLTGFWAVAFANPEAGWLAGTNGRIQKISF